MKIYSLIITGLTIVLSFSSCKEDVFTNETNNTQNKNEIYVTYPSKMVMTKGTTSEFELNWENQDDVQTANIKQPIPLPWSSKITDANIDINVARDIKKEDGWTFLFHTFDDANDGADTRNYMGFYNQRTGIMKIFYYQKDFIQSNNSGAWHVNLDNDEEMFNTTNDIADPIDKNKTNYWMGTNHVTLSNRSFCQGWNCFLVSLAYVPRNGTETFLSIRSQNNNETIIDLFGTYNSYSKGIILTKGESNEITQLKDGSLTINGESAEQWIDNAIADGKIKYNTNTRIDIIKTIEVIGKVANVFNKMLSTFKKEEPTVTKSDLEFTTRGIFNISGTATFTTGGIPSSLRIPFNKADVGELGAWNLSKSPVIYMNPLADCAETNINPSMGSAKYKLRGIKSIDCDVVINPSLQPYVKRYWVETEMVRYWGVPNDTPVIPDYYTDFGTLGRRNAPTGFQPEYKTENLIYESAENNQKMYKYDMKNTYTVTGVKNTRGYYIPVYQNGTPLSTIFVPNSSSYNNQFFELTNAYLRVKLYMVTEMHGKEETTMSMRTFIPKIEWDTQLYNAYKNLSPEEIANL